MFSDEEIKEKHHKRDGDEIISIKKVCLSDKNKRDLDEYYGPLSPLSTQSTRGETDLREGYFPLDADTRFPWSEEDLAMDSQSFGSTQPSFGKDSDAAWKREIKDEVVSELLDIETAVPKFSTEMSTRAATPQEYNTRVTGAGSGELFAEGGSSTKENICTSSEAKETSLSSRPKLKVDKSDPRSRLHYVKLVKRNGRTIKFWECGICGRDFLHQYTLMRHLPTHTDERNFRCEECSKSFRQLSTLSQHRAIHSADRPYGCQVCLKTFNRLSTLISHRKTHSGEKLYKCNICSKGFHQKGNLRNHMFTHTNERPYRCNICMTGFNQQSNLVCHKIKAHPEANDSNAKSDIPPIVKVRSINQLLEKSTAVNPHQNCEVSSSTFGYTSLDPPPSGSADEPGGPAEGACTSTGVIVDPISTLHMGVAVAAKQTPFALIKSDGGPPILVKVLDVEFPRGKQMLVPATAEDLMFGGRIVYSDKRDDEPVRSEARDVIGPQVRVPVVAVVVPTVSEGRLRLAVEEPHQGYHAPTSGGTGPPSCGGVTAEAGGCSLLTSDPTPPLDISLDLFDTMECMPLGSRLSSDNDIQHPRASDKTNIMDIVELRDSILLSDSE